VNITRPRRDAGFTLIEVLVVVIIIGILSAIAIPSFANQRKKAVDASGRTDARHVAAQLEAFWVTYQAYPDPGAVPTEISWAAPTLVVGDEPLPMSPGNTPRVFLGDGGGICVQITNPRATDPATGVVWATDRGGQQARGTDCADYATVLI
jgi:type IV pilus assembly protein PilA